MSTEAQIKANRKNAQKSTGPRTEEGKETASQNAIKHSLCSCKNVISCESQDEYNLFREEMIDDLSPFGAMEEMLAERIVNLSWRLKRAVVFQNAVVESFADDILSSNLNGYIRSQNQAKKGDMSLVLGDTIRRDFSSSKVLEQLLVYEKRIESSLYKAAAEFRKLQKLRLEREAIDGTRRTKDEGRNAIEEARETRDDKDFAKRPASQESCAETRTQFSESHPQTAFDFGDLSRAVAATPDIDDGRETMDEGMITDNSAKQSQIYKRPETQDIRREAE